MGDMILTVVFHLFIALLLLVAIALLGVLFVGTWQFITDFEPHRFNIPNFCWGQ